MKESFILYNSFYEPIKALKNEQLGKLLRSIFDYTINGTITQDKDILVAFMFIKNQIDLDTKKWEEERTKRSEAGKKGMQNRWHNNDNNVITKDNNVINAITNISDNVNDNVDVNVDVSSTTNIYEYVEEALGRTLNGIEYEEINKWDDNELTRYAIKQATLSGGRSIKYIQAILNSYKAKGIMTIKDAINNDGKRKRNKPEWFDKKIAYEKIDKKQQKELEEMIKEFN